jgi:Putative zinc-finger
MFLNHVSRKISSYCHNALPPEEAARVSAHLEQCQRCRRWHAKTASIVELLGYLERIRAPVLLWDDIERRRSRPAPLPVPQTSTSAWLQRRRGPIAAVAALLMGMAALETLRVTQESPGRAGISDELDLGSYLHPVQAALPAASYRVLARAAPGFDSRERDDALPASGLRSVPDASPLAGYHLQAQHIGSVGAHRVVQLIYGNGNEAFSVFVAPAAVRFRFGSQDAFDTVVQGIRCVKVDCPKQQTYAFQEGSYQWVLVSKSLDPARAAIVMRYFIAAHQREVDNDARQTRNFVR